MSPLLTHYGCVSAMFECKSSHTFYTIRVVNIHSLTYIFKFFDAVASI